MSNASATSHNDDNRNRDLPTLDEPARVLIVDDDKMVRDGLRDILDGQATRLRQPRTGRSHSIGSRSAPLIFSFST